MKEKTLTGEVDHIETDEYSKEYWWNLKIKTATELKHNRPLVTNVIRKKNTRERGHLWPIDKEFANPVFK